MKKLFFLPIFLPLFLLAQTQFVNPLVGTDGHGHTYPGAAMPFGLVQLSPDTRLTGWDGCSAYHYSDSILHGFSHTHLSGTGCSDYGDILLMPFLQVKPTDKAKTDFLPKEFTATFSHKNETASPGYYALTTDNGIFSEMTITSRTGMHKYTFPKENEGTGILLDLAHRDEVLDFEIKVSGKNEIWGFRKSKAWAKAQIVFFVIRFETDFSTLFWLNEHNKPETFTAANPHKYKKLAIVFPQDKQKNSPLKVKVGISGTSVEGAIKNLKAENPDWNFDKIKLNAETTWKKELSKIEVEGGTLSQKRTFYTALYHTMLSPNIYSDVDGKYRGRDNKVHQTNGWDYYTVFSLWDTYRALHPLLGIIDRKRSLDFVQTFLRQYQEGGILPVWELSANETNCMIGYHAVPVIWDAYSKGITDFDTELAFSAMKHSAEMKHLGLDSYQKNGFVRADKEHESVSKTLEYAYDDWCIAQMAKALGKMDDYNVYLRRSQQWRNLFDPETHFFRARMNGGWYKPFRPTEVNNHYTEANAWQYLFAVPQDIAGLSAMMGGAVAFDKKLDELFSTEEKMSGREQVDITGLIGQYAQGNEPSHHVAYLYAYNGFPWKVADKVHPILTQFYDDTPAGLCGNEDCGQMSAWYVLSAMGFYPACPGSNQYVFGTPLFEKIKIQTGGNKPFVIHAQNLSDKNYHIQSANWNGKNYDNFFLTDKMLQEGGNLEWRMGWQPLVRNWIVPSTLSAKEGAYIPAPIIEAKSKTFLDNMEVTLSFAYEGLKQEFPAKIYYTLDGSEPDSTDILYQKPIILSKTATITAIAFRSKTRISPSVSATFHQIPKGRQVSLMNCKPNSQYYAGGEMALIDGIRGQANWRTGDWMGFQGQDFEAVLDLGKEQDIHSLSAGFLQDVGSWIVMPKMVEFWIAGEDRNYVKAAEISHNISDRETENLIHDFVYKRDFSKKVRFVKVKAKSYGNLPAWHLGAGGESFIFIDEIMVE